MTHDIHEVEQAANPLLAFASRFELEGLNLYAFVIYDKLAKADIVRQGQALIGEARTQVKMPSLEMFERAEKKFEHIIEKHDRPTGFRAIALRYLAESKIALKKFDEAETLLEEAARIQTDQGADWYLGATVRAQGLVHVWKGEFWDAVERFNNAKTLSEIGMQDMRLTGLGVEGRQMVTSEEASLFTVAGIN